MKNQVYTGTPTSRRFILCPSTVIAGEPLLIGTEPCVALDSYSSATGGTTVLLNGTFILRVGAWTGSSPLTGAALKPGDKVYASGTLDSTTNVTSGLTISGNTGGTFFGRIDPTGPAMTAGDSTNANVEIGME